MLGWFSKDKKEKAIKQAIDEFKQNEAQRFEDYLRVKDEEKRKAEEAEAARIKELEEVAKRVEEEKEQALKNSDKPWVKVESAEVDNNGNIGIKLDWNQAFIHYLRHECNFEGDEEKIIHMWLAALYREMVVDGRNNALDILKHFPDSLEKGKEPQ